MQQTETYKLNKPGIDDPLAIAPLNENADALDAALAALDETAAGLDARVTALEIRKIVVGSYVGNGGTQTIPLGFTPRAVFITTNYVGYGYYALVLEGLPPKANTSAGRIALEIVDNGFTAYTDANVGVNRSNEQYRYIAFG